MARRPLKKVKRQPRHVHVPGAETPADKAQRTAVQQITQNPFYPAILAAIRQGVPNTKIAEHFIARGAFEVNQKTATGYLQYFRKAQPGLCKPQKPEGSEEPSNPISGYDHLFDGNSIIIHEETELLRLIALQKARIGMGFNNEREINVLMQSNRREVEELRNLLMDLAKLRGLWGNNVNVSFTGYSESVKDDLKGIQQDEGQRNVIATLVADLGNRKIGTET